MPACPIASAAAKIILEGISQKNKQTPSVLSASIITGRNFHIILSDALQLPLVIVNINI